LTQVSSPTSLTIKLLHPLIISDDDCDWILSAFDSVISDSRRVPGAVWSLGKVLVGHAARGSISEPTASV